jgi:hypothetical protein
LGGILLEGITDVNIEYEENGINTQNEKSLHADLKRWYGRPGDRYEAKVEGSIIDILRNELLIEIQTRNFRALNKKLSRLCETHKVRLVYPVPREKYIVYTDKHGSIIKRRKSPKSGRLLDLFDELVSIPVLASNENLSIDVLLVDVEETRCQDGRGSWRRKGNSVVDRRLIGVVDSMRFDSVKDFKELIPDGIEQPFSNKSLAQAMEVPVAIAQKITYCYRRMDIIELSGKKGNELLFSIK